MRLIRLLVTFLSLLVLAFALTIGVNWYLNPSSCFFLQNCTSAGTFVRNTDPDSSLVSDLRQFFSGEKTQQSKSYLILDRVSGGKSTSLTLDPSEVGIQELVFKQADGGRSEVRRDLFTNTVLSLFNPGKTPDLESKNDAPSVRDYLKLTYPLNGVNEVLYVYKKGNDTFVERPYQGIWSIPESTFEVLQDVFKK